MLGARSRDVFIPTGDENNSAEAGLHKPALNFVFMSGIYSQLVILYSTGTNSDEKTCAQDVWSWCVPVLFIPLQNKS